MAPPAVFPALPGPGPPSHWGYTINRVHKIISQSYSQALQVLHREDGDALRLKYHLHLLQSQIRHLLENLQSTELPPLWLNECAHGFGQLLVELAVAAKGAAEK
jgi:hypothetical protein